MKISSHFWYWGLAAGGIVALVLTIRELQIDNRGLSQQCDRSVTVARQLYLRVQTAREQVARIKRAEIEFDEAKPAGSEQRQRALRLALDQMLAENPLRPPPPLVPGGRHGIWFPELMRDRNSGV